MDFMRKNFFILEGLMALTLIALPQMALAYLDPGTGSYLIQIILSAVFGGLFAIKMFYQQIKSFFSKLFTRKRK